MAAIEISGISELWVPNQSGLFGGYLPTIVSSPEPTVLDAASEEVHMIGYCYLEGRTSNKVISTSGPGKIHFMAGASITFADASTTLRVGIQDVAAASGPAARGDGTHDVYGEFVGGTDTISSTTWTTVNMESGTKTITHGQLICVAFTMISRGGSDTVKIRTPLRAGGTVTSMTGHMPQVTLVTSGPTYTAQNSAPCVVIEFDDGTLGFIEGGWVSNTVGSSTVWATATSIDTGTASDEYALIFQFPAPVTIDAAKFFANPEGTASSEFEVILYSDPEGTPAAIETITVDPNNAVANNSVRQYVIPFTTLRDLTADTKYALAIRPTTANNVTIYTYTVSDANHWKAHPLGANCYLGTRADQTGAFSTTATSRLLASVRIAKIDDGTGASGGGGSLIGGRIVK